MTLTLKHGEIIPSTLHMLTASGRMLTASGRMLTASGRMLTAAAFVVAFSLSSVGAQAQDGDVEEVIVTGSYIKQTPGDTPLPVDVINADDLFDQGSPSIVELIKTIGVSSGVDGETNQFQSNGLEGTANVNLRGLGAGRNLVLLNGRRNVFNPYAIGEQAQLFVDINNIPGVALQRIEILKDGAAATYGSDAISGVVNFITRANFEGVELAASYQAIDGSDNDLDLGLIAGGRFGDTHLVGSFGYQTRGELPARERDFAIQHFGNLDNGRGYTGIPNPGSYFPLSTFPTGSFRDPRCTSFIGVGSANNPNAARSNCTYNYVYFDNLVEEENRYQFFGELTHDFSDDLQLTAEILYAKSEVPSWKTSPSYPPQTLIDLSPATGRFIPSYHPGLIAMAAIDVAAVNANAPTIMVDHDGDPDTAEVARPTTGWIGRDGTALTTNPFTAFADATCAPTSRAAANCDALLSFGRPFGISGPAETGFREHETMRFAIGLEGAVTDDVDFTTSLLWTAAEGMVVSPDTYSERWALALRGYGGPDCAADEATPGANGCLFINPFSNSVRAPQSKYAAISVNPDATDDTVNDPAVTDWIKFDLGSVGETNLIVADVVFTGEVNENLSWAAGAQYRQEERTFTPFDENNLNLNPCNTAAENKQFRDRYDSTYDANSRQCEGATRVDLTDTTLLESIATNEQIVVAQGVIVSAQNAIINNDDSTTAEIATATTTRNAAQTAITAAELILADAGEGDNYTGSGQFIFLAGATPSDRDQSIIALFGEIIASPHEDVEIQASLRYEDYGGTVGESIDPKIAVRWAATDNITLRSSISTTFRGPTLNQLDGRITTLSFVPATTSFKAVDTLGNANLKPESALSINAGLIFDYQDLGSNGGEIFASIDYWRFDFKDPIIRESFNDLIDVVFDGDGDRRVADGTDAGDAAAAIADIYFPRFTLSGAGTSSDIERILVNIINGPDIETSGIDFAITYAFDVPAGRLEIGGQWTYTIDYEVSALVPLIPTFDALGKLNDNVDYLRPLIEHRAKLNFRWNYEGHTLNSVMNYTGKYADSIEPTLGAIPDPAPRDIDAHVTYDIHYNVNFGELDGDRVDTTFFASIYNLLDEDPPFARLDLNYDPYTHNALGRRIKAGVRFTF